MVDYYNYVYIAFIIKFSKTLLLHGLSNSFLLYFRGSPFFTIRGSRVINENRPIRHIHDNPYTIQNPNDIFSNEVNVDDSFSYESSAEFESSNVYGKLRGNSNQGFYRLMVP